MNGDHNKNLKTLGASERKSCALFLAIVTITAVGFAPVANADEYEDLPELPSIEVRGMFPLPTITRAVSPRVPESMIGTEVRMTFKVNKKGKPYEIRHNATILDENEYALAEAMRQKLRLWRFKPALDKQGNLVAVKLALPVEVVPSGTGNAADYATKASFKPVLLAVLDK